MAAVNFAASRTRSTRRTTTGARRTLHHLPMVRKSFGRVIGESRVDRCLTLSRGSTGPVAMKDQRKEIVMKDNRYGNAFGRIPATFWAALLILASSEASLAGPYKLAPGDTIEVSVGGVPDQRNRMQIQIDG